jgi:hypothetical protein
MFRVRNIHLSAFDKVCSAFSGRPSSSTSRISIWPTDVAPHTARSDVERRLPLLPVLLVPKLGELVLQALLDRLLEGSHGPCVSRQRVAPPALASRKLRSLNGHTLDPKKRALFCSILPVWDRGSIELTRMCSGF